MLWRVLSRVLLIEAGLMLVPLAAAAIYGESVLPFLWTILIVIAVAGVLWLLGRGAGGSLHTREGFVSVSLSWIIISLFGALPFVFSGAIPNYIDALFEIISGFTTTGASILTDIESLPRGILFWRSFSHWIGGMGVLVFMMAVLPMDDEHSMHLLRAEVPGPVKGKLLPRMRETARTLYKIYIALTVIETGLLLCGGLPLYDALVTAFGTAGTGGFSVLAESIGGYGSAYVEIVTAVFMLLFGINFNLYYIALIRRSIRGFKSQELYCYLLIIVFATVTIGLNISAQYGGFVQSLRYSFFQVTAIISSTGYATADFNLWPAYSRTLLLMLMLVGACAGSTGGGMKMSRCMIAVKAAGQELHRQLFPRSVNRVTLDGERIGTETIRSTLIYLLLYALLVIGGSLLLSLNGLDLETTVTSVISCLSNIGPGLGLVGPMGSFAVWSQASKLLLCLFMIMGRLEIFPIILMFTPNVWYSSQKRAGHRHGRLHRGE